LAEAYLPIPGIYPLDPLFANLMQKRNVHIYPHSKHGHLKWEVS
jgi:hypothetical protein